MPEKFVIIEPSGYGISANGLRIGDVICLSHSIFVDDSKIEITNRDYHITATNYIRSPKSKPYNGAPVSARDIKRFERGRKK